ncbi:hypothetical protein KAR91_45355 [Candidatus Pacearchaeota archaeon]|nr:hypothetical protein [Candidatus Pacearchaeota archaeon]
MIFIRGIGTNHVVESNINPQEWIYTVNIVNLTLTTFEEICMFYKPKNVNGVVFIRAGNVEPRVITTFRLGVCRDLEAYVIGFFYKEDDKLYSFKIPEEGNIYPPIEPEPCADSFEIHEEMFGG